MTVEEATQRAFELREAERAGWPKGFDQKAIHAAWDAVIWTLASAYETTEIQTPEIAPVIWRQFLRTLDPDWGKR